MKIYTETGLDSFKFWSGARDTIEELTKDEIKEIEAILEELDVDDEGMSDTEVNDFFWFERDTIAEWLGYNDFDEIIERNREE